MEKYNPEETETKWRQLWSEKGTFAVDLKTASKPFYNLMMFPYPSGEGLHVGHVYAFGGADTYGRFQRMKGNDVFEPMGFDAFGIHSENFAIKKNLHPKDLIKQTTSYFRTEQLEKLGALFDWEHSVDTTDPKYYRFTQELFLRLYRAKLAIKKEAPVQFCPSCKTVLADEQVISGRCERCNSEVVQKVLSQWFFKITDYAQRLLDNLDKLDWSETTLEMQRNWIGRSEGAEVDFEVVGSKGKKITVFTTRPDTLYGATFLVVAPEHPLVNEIFSSKETVKDYVKRSLNKSEVDRLSTVKEKTGVDTGFFATNPLTGKPIPVWIADYVLGSYGTGAIMAVPAHDTRDYEFAQQNNLPIVEVISGGEVSKEPWLGDGKLINSGNFNGQNVQEAKKNISKYIEENSFGSIKVNFHLRDWLISRQRYWGPPIPIIYCHHCWEKNKTNKANLTYGWDYTNLDGKDYMIREVPEKDLPVLLPDITDFKPLGTGKSPLATSKEFMETTCPQCGGSATRESDVSDTFLDSSWYFLRYPSVGKDTEAFDKELTKRWLPVNMYIGGNEHAVLHLLYSRFVTMVLHDLDLISFEEPFTKFRAHGLIIHQGAKMSKSRGNVINPNDYIAKFGADTLRVYLLFIGPYEQGGDFSVRGIGGVARFFNRIFTSLETVSKETKADAKDEAKRLQFRHKTIERVTTSLENLRFNTAIASLMEYLNNLNKIGATKEDLEVLIKLLAPLAPHFSEEAWERLRIKNQEVRSKNWENKDSVHNQSWPSFDTKLTEQESQTIIVQINGKVRDRLEVGTNLPEEEIFRLALDRENVMKYIGETKIKDKIFVKGKLLNLVI